MPIYFNVENAIINIYTSLIFDKFENELYIYTDSVDLHYILEDGKFKITNDVINLLNQNKLNWYSLLGISNNYKIKLEELNSLNKEKIRYLYYAKRRCN